MSDAARFLIAGSCLTIVLIMYLRLRPNAQLSTGGRALTFLALFLLPTALTWGGAEVHLSHAKSTEFCMSCHEMEPYGRSLLLADPEHLPAGHYQNNRVSKEQACFSCHTEYTMFGDAKAKARGLRHLYVHYLGGPRTAPIKLYEPYRNRECFHCHGTQREFMALEEHVEMMGELVSDELSCLECHDKTHAAGQQDALAHWTPPDAAADPVGGLLAPASRKEEGR